MLSDQFSILLRAFMILGGLAGFLIGMGLSLWRDVPIAMAFFRGAVACAACAMLMKLMMMSLFRAHLKALQARKQQASQPPQTPPV
jgi:hypothetical protein